MTYLTFVCLSCSAGQCSCFVILLPIFVQIFELWIPQTTEIGVFEFWVQQELQTIIFKKDL